MVYKSLETGNCLKKQVVCLFFLCGGFFVVFFCS